MALEINIASIPCCVCKEPLVNCNAFADTPIKTHGNRWGYVCDDFCGNLIQRGIATMFSVVLTDGFAIGRKIERVKALKI